MTSKIFAALAAALIFCDAGAAGAASRPVVWSIGEAEGVQAPESAYYDAASRSLFVSQMGAGGATGKDGDGFVSRLDVAGTVLEHRWATGLNAPKGMRAHDGTLWVADVDRLVAIRVATGEIAREVAVPGAKFLNDVACDGDGAVYVSDMVTGRIHRYRDGRLSVFAEGDALGHPNGLLVEGDRLIVASWGHGLGADFGTETPGGVFALDLKTRARTDLTAEPLGNLDGIEADGQGGYIVTDWVAGKVFRVANGAARTLLSLPKGAADVAFLTDTRRLIVPEMLENKVTAFDLSADF